MAQMRDLTKLQDDAVRRARAAFEDRRRFLSQTTMGLGATALAALGQPLRAAQPKADPRFPPGPHHAPRARRARSTCSTTSQASKTASVNRCHLRSARASA